MMSSTSITSTSGTTLISDSEVDTRCDRPRRPPPPVLDACTFGISQWSLDFEIAIVYVKLRSAMFKNSSEKSSISPAKYFTRPVK